MLTLIIILIFGIATAIFATQNTQHVSIAFANYHVGGVPMYLIVLAALLLGIFISWLISTVGSITSLLTLRGKDRKIKESKKETIDLTRRMHQLELENERLKTELDRSGDEKSL